MGLGKMGWVKTVQVKIGQVKMEWVKMEWVQMAWVNMGWMKMGQVKIGWRLDDWKRYDWKANGISKVISTKRWVTDPRQKILCSDNMSLAQDQLTHRVNNFYRRISHRDMFHWTVSFMLTPYSFFCFKTLQSDPILKKLKWINNHLWWCWWGIDVMESSAFQRHTGEVKSIQIRLGKLLVWIV